MYVVCMEFEPIIVAMAVWRLEISNSEIMTVFKILQDTTDDHR